MPNKIILLLAIFVFSLSLFSEEALAGSCAGGKGVCRTNVCSVNENPITDTTNDCWASSDEVCCSAGGSVIGGCKDSDCPKGQSCQGWFTKTCEAVKTDCSTTGCPKGQECSGIFTKTCENIKTDCTTTGCPNGQVCTGLFTKTCETASTTAPISGSGTSGYQPSSASASGGWSLSNISGFGLPAAPISGIAGNLLDWLLGILAVTGVIGFIISGIIYLVSTGNEIMIDRAKEAMTWSIVGVIVGLSGVIIIQAVDWALNGFGGF